MALVVCVAALPALAAPRVVHAKVFLGNEAAMTAGSAGALTRSSEAVWYNPAGLGGTVKNKLDLSASAFVYRVQRVGGLISILTSKGVSHITGAANELVAIPAALVFTRNLTPRVSVGLGVFVSEALDTVFKMSFSSSGERVPGIATTVDGNVGMEFQTQGSLYFFGPSIGIELLPNLRVGASLFVVYSNRRVSGQIFSEVHGSTNPADASIFYTQSLLFSRSLVGLQAVAGVQWDATRRWHFGLVLRSPAYVFYRFGAQSTVTTTGGFRGPPPVTYDPNAHSVSADSSEYSQGGLHGFLPLTIEPSIAFTGERFWLGIVGEIRPPRSNATLFVDRKALWNVRVGGRARVGKSSSLGFGLYTDNSDARTTKGLGESTINFYGLTAGFETKNIFNIQKLLARYKLQLSTTVALGYAIGVGDVAGWRYDPIANPAAGEVVTKSAVFHEFSLHIGSSLRF